MAFLEAVGAGLLASKFARIAVAVGVLVFFWAVVFPPVVLPTEFENSITTFAGYLYPFGKMIPITTIFTVIGLVLVFEAGFLAFKIFNWLWELD